MIHAPLGYDHCLAKILDFVDGDMMRSMQAAYEATGFISSAGRVLSKAGLRAPDTMTDTWGFSRGSIVDECLQELAADYGWSHPHDQDVLSPSEILLLGMLSPAEAVEELMLAAVRPHMGANGHLGYKPAFRRRALAQRTAESLGHPAEEVRRLIRQFRLPITACKSTLSRLRSQATTWLKETTSHA